MKIAIIILFNFMAISVIAQKNTQKQKLLGNDTIITFKKTKEFNHIMTLDVDYLSGSLSYIKRINEKWAIGGGAGYGRSVNLIIIAPSSFFTALGEWINVKYFGRYEISNHFQFDFGLQAASIIFGIKNSDCECIAGVLGAYSGFTFGWRYLKIGSQIVFGVVGYKGVKFINYYLPFFLRFIIPGNIFKKL